MENSWHLPWEFFANLAANIYAEEKRARFYFLVFSFYVLKLWPLKTFVCALN